METATKSRRSRFRQKNNKSVILLYKTLKASELLAKTITPSSSQKRCSTQNIISNNLNVSVYAHIIKCYYQLLVKLYERKKARLYR